MREQPSGLALLEIAASTLKTQIVPALADEHKYLGLMVLNAISIASRQLVLDESAREQQCNALAAALQVPVPGPESGTDPLAALERKLARAVRAGAFDDGDVGPRLLWELTVARLRESAPRTLESESRERGE